MTPIAKLIDDSLCCVLCGTKGVGNCDCHAKQSDKDIAAVKWIVQQWADGKCVTYEEDSSEFTVVAAFLDFGIWSESESGTIEAGNDHPGELDFSTTLLKATK